MNHGTGRGAFLALIGVVVAGFLAGCGTGDVVTGGDGASAVEIATYEPAGSGGDSALLTGTLEDDGGCLVVEQDDGERVVPVLPRGEADGSDGIRLLGRNYAIGDRVELGGGYTSEAPQALPAVCADPELPHFIVATP